MDKYKETVMKGNLTYEQVGQYVTKKACGLLKFEVMEYYKAY